MALKEQRQKLEPNPRIGLNIRNRAVEYAFIEDCVAVRNSIVYLGNGSAHDGDVLADGYLYTELANLKRNDCQQFRAHNEALIRVGTR
jgi:hypothetical protein